MMYGYNGYGDWGYGSMMGGFGGIVMIAFWVLLIVCIVWLVREFTEKNSKSNLNALDILRERYARGEIEKEEFESKKKDLSQ